MFFSVILSDVPNITYVISIISIFFQQKSTVIGFISFDGTKIKISFDTSKSFVDFLSTILHVASVGIKNAESLALSTF